MKDISLIPPGPYCYAIDGRHENGTLKIKSCPYWSIDPMRQEQENGYCSFLEKGDWDINKDAIFIDGKTGEKITCSEVGFGAGLLWDQCKECGINDGWDE